MSTRVQWTFQPYHFDIETTSSAKITVDTDPMTFLRPDGEPELREGIVQQYIVTEHGPAAVILWEKLNKDSLYGEPGGVDEYELVVVQLEGLKVLTS